MQIQDFLVSGKFLQFQAFFCKFALSYQVDVASVFWGVYLDVYNRHRMSEGTELLTQLLVTTIEWAQLN